jgi:hypothetical protein
VVFLKAHIIPKMLRPSTQRAEFFGTIAYTMAGFEDRCQDIEDPCRGRLVSSLENPEILFVSHRRSQDSACCSVGLSMVPVAPPGIP